MKLTLSLTFLLVSLVSVQSYVDPIRCEGEIPGMFINGLNNHVKLQEEIHKDYFSKDKKLDDLKEQLILGSTINQSFYFRNGLILFGDPISKYLNKIKEEILKNDRELNSELKVFTLNTSEVNAYCTLEGNIYFSTGLLARVKSEAELAFIMSHEISHYTSKHLFERLKTEKEVDELSKLRKKLTIEDLLRLKSQRSKKQELEADSLGYIIYSKTDYNPAGSLESFNTLSLSHLPCGNTAFDKAFFNSEHFKIPNSFFMDSVASVEAKETEEDEFASHPDLAERKEKVKKFLPKKINKDKKEYIVSSSEFQKAQGLASFEALEKVLINRKYGDAIYSAYSLLKRYPNDERLNTILIKALYGAAKYKNEQVFHFASSSYIQKQGEVQQVGYFLKQISASQLNILALKKAHGAKRKFPANKSWDLIESDLVDDLVTKHKISLKDFYSVSQIKEKYSVQTVKEIIASTPSKIEQRQKFKNYFLAALCEEKEDDVLKAKFTEAERKLQISQEEENLSYKETEKRKEEKAREIAKNGYGINAKDILLFEPEYFKLQKDAKSSLEKSENEKQEFVDDLKIALNRYNKNIKVLTVSDLREKDTEIYNTFAKASGWLQERNSHLKKVEILPLSNEFFKNNKELSQYKFFCTIDIAKVGNNDLTYVFNLYDTDSGKKVYTNQESLPPSLRLSKILKYVLEDFDLIIN